jgi:hypothetical protein
MGTWLFTGGKAAGAWSWPPTKFSAKVNLLALLYFTYAMFILAIGDSFTASFRIRPMIATDLELSFIWAEHVLFETEWCRCICCCSRIQLPLNKFFSPPWIWYWAIFAWDRCVRSRYSKWRNRIYCCCPIRRENVNSEPRMRRSEGNNSRVFNAFLLQSKTSLLLTVLWEPSRWALRL